MNSLAHQLYAVLQEHPGRDEAITVDELQSYVGHSARRIRQAIQQLVIAERIPIASTVHPPYGFYLITDAAEARECLQQYWARVREVSRRAKILNQIVKEQFGIDGQQEFRFDEPEEEITDEERAL